MLNNFQVNAVSAQLDRSGPGVTRTLLVAAALCAAGGAHAALEGRDLDLNTPGYEGVFDGTKTWAANAQASGFVTYYDALTFVASLNIGGYTGWRMIGWNDGLHGMYNEWKIAMQKKHWFDPNTDTDVGVGSHFFQPAPGGPNYWMADTLIPGHIPQATWVYWDIWQGDSWGGGTSAAGVRSGFAWAVHDGDIGVPAPVPEPQTWALMLAGIGALGVAGRRRSR